MGNEFSRIEELTLKSKKVNISVKVLNINEKNDMSNRENEHQWRSYNDRLNHRRSGIYWGIKLVRNNNYRLKGTYGKRKRTKLIPMFNMKKETVFRYYMNEILNDSKTEEKYFKSFIATTISKASRKSTKDARDYIKVKCDEEMIDRDVEKEILQLLNRFTKYR